MLGFSLIICMYTNQLVHFMFLADQGPHQGENEAWKGIIDLGALLIEAVI